MRPTPSRRVLLPVALSGASVALLAAAPTAGATCAPGHARQMVAGADVAFVGRLVATSPPDGTATFAVDEPLKGGPPAEVVVHSEMGPSFIYALSSPAHRTLAPGTVGLVARRGPSGELLSSICGLLRADVLRAAAASGRTECLAPSALPLTARTRRGSRVVRLSARVSGGEAGGALRVDWGDGRTTRIPLDPSGPGRVSARATHAYPRTGAFRIRAVVETPVPVDCGGARPTTPAAPAPPATSPVRARTVRLRAAR